MLLQEDGGKGCVVVFAAGNSEESSVLFPANLSKVIAVGGISYCGERKSPYSCDCEDHWGSNFGTDLDIMAPCVLISTTDLNDVNIGLNPNWNWYPYPWDGDCLNLPPVEERSDYPDYRYTAWFRGTSAACPYVSGVAALVLSVNPDLTSKQVRNIIESTAQKVRQDLYDYQPTCLRPNGTWHEEMGHGLVDAYAAVLKALEPRCNTDIPIVQGTITQNTSWNTPMQVTGSITIPDGVTLWINSQVKCEDNASIIIQPGGKIILDGGILTNACEGEMWQGITVLGDTNQPIQQPYQGYIQVINGTIENATCGITVKGGGIVNATSALFRNNKAATHFEPISTIQIGTSGTFIQTIFDLDCSYLGNFTDVAQLKMDNSGQVFVTDCSFSSIVSLNSNNGIVAINTLSNWDGDNHLFSVPISIQAGSLLTVSNNSALNFHQKGKLTIEKNAAMIIQNNAQINGVLCENDTTIHVKGGGFIVGNDVVFNNLNGILLENQDTQGQPYYDETIQYNFRNVTFNNTLLTHSATPLNISNCTFNSGSHVNTSISSSNIDSCTFNQTTFKSSLATMTEAWQDVIVSNCHFIANNNIDVALQINSARILEIYNNTIIGYETGVDLTSSGATIAYYEGCKTVSAIHDNEISNCTTGIELYNSIVNISGSYIHNNYFGVRLFNNSSTSFGRLENPTKQPQIIRDNDSYELYTSLNSFPEIFRFNQIIDEDNLGNEFDDPIIYWDLDNLGKFPLSMLRDVKYNCWGDYFDPLEDFYPFKYFVYEPIWQCGKSISKTLDADEILFQIGLEYFADLDFINAETIFKDIIENYPHSTLAIAAMHELFSLEHFLNNDFYSLHDYFTSFSPSDSNLFDVADYLATRCYVTNKNWQPAVDWYEYRIENPPSYQDSVFAVIDLGDIHLMMETDTLNGAKGRSLYTYHLKDIKPKSKQHFEETRTTLLATLPQIKKPQKENPQSPYSDTNQKGSLEKCVPNPVTGNATITFEIYIEGLVEIRIYNALGQLLQNLSQGKLYQGHHQVKIDLSGMPAGLYHYSLFINSEQIDAKKMIVN